MARYLVLRTFGWLDHSVNVVCKLTQRNKKDMRLEVRERTSASVVRWFRTNGRTFPWRESVNPFHILIAEVLLRQTQAPRVVGPYLQLIARYPDPESLSRANIQTLRQWFRPLGLVTRADHLVKSARILLRDHSGKVPNKLEHLEALPGLGRYSARAVLCLAFNQTVPMIDEGSGRVMRRVLGYENEGPAYSDPRLMEAVVAILPHNGTREFNLGLIDVAAAYCHPRIPDCGSCPLKEDCSEVSCKNRNRP